MVIFLFFSVLQRVIQKLPGSITLGTSTTIGAARRNETNRCFVWLLTLEVSPIQRHICRTSHEFCVVRHCMIAITN